MIDTKKRTLLKSVSWKTIGFCFLTLLTYIALGDLTKGGLLSLFYHILMMLIFIFHERIWNMISWGKTRGLFIQMTGMSGAGKSTLTNIVAQDLRKSGLQVEVLDGDEYREGLCSDLGFSREDRNTNIRRLGFVSHILERNNVISIIAAINPYDDVREELKKYGNVKTVFVDCDIEELKARDTKGLYARALLEDGHPDKVYNFTGISDPYESPLEPDLVVSTDKETISESAKKLKKFIMGNIS